MTDRPEAPVQRQNAPQVGEGTGEGDFPPDDALWGAVTPSLADHRRVSRYWRDYLASVRERMMRATVANDGESVGNAGGKTPNG